MKAAALAGSIGALVAISTSLHAGVLSTYWTHDPAEVGDWFGPNWSVVLPQPNVDAFINNAGTAEISYGTATADALHVGYWSYSSADGNLIVSGGELQARAVYVGTTAHAVVDHTDGTIVVAEDLQVGDGSAVPDYPNGTYNFSGGHISAGTVRIGGEAPGVFNWTGGTIDTPLIYLGNEGVLTLGWDYHNDLPLQIDQGRLDLRPHDLILDTATSNGLFTLESGAVFASGETVGRAGAGLFSHQGGANVSQGLILGDRPSGMGAYQLGETAELTGPTQIVGYDGFGNFRQTGGTNRVDVSLTLGHGRMGVGVYTLAAGELRCRGNAFVGLFGTGRFLQTGGSHEVQGELTLGHHAGSSGTYEIAGGTLRVHTLRVGGDGAGTVRISDAAAEVVVTGLLRFGPEGAFSAAQASVIRLEGASLDNHSTDPGALAGLEATNLLVVHGGEEASYLEVAGADLGPTPEAWDDNFALGALTVGGDEPGRIVLVDLFDNRPDHDGPEALYVKTLTLGAGAGIDLNALNLYYLNGGQPKQLFLGDANLDGGVNVQDLSVLATNWEASAAEWAMGDCTGDGIVNIQDLSLLATNWGAGANAPPVPEPATVLLLTVGLAWLGTRRRSGRGPRADWSARAALLAAMWAALTAPTWAGETYWRHDPASTGDWSDAQNWTSGTPTNADDACIDNQGTAEIAAGQAQARMLCLGLSPGGSGTLVQPGGVLSLGDLLLLGAGAGSSGTCRLSGSAQLSSPYATIGHGGNGLFAQSGGTCTVSSMLTLGGQTGSTGTWTLSDGNLDVGFYEFIGNEGSGTVEHTGGAHTVGFSLTLGGWAGSVGTYALSGVGTLSVPDEYIGDDGIGDFLQTGGTHHVTQRLVLGQGPGSEGDYTLSGGSLCVGELLVGPVGRGTLNLAPPGDLLVTASLVLGPGARLSAQPGSSIRVAGPAVEIQSADPDALAGLGELTLILEAGADVTTDLEAAGADLGADPAAWSGNFALAELVLGGAAPGRLRLVDESDNHPGQSGSEAVYVRNLSLNAGAAVELGGLNLYYLNDGPPKRLIPGDANLDGAVDVQDLSILATNWEISTADWAMGDYTGGM